MQELELKLSLPTTDPDSLASKLSEVPVLAAAVRAGNTRHNALHNVYFDTPSLALHSRRIALRIRQKGSAHNPQWLQTLKMGGSSHSALSQRGEWEFPLTEPHLSHSLLQQTPWPGFDPDGTVFAALQTCFTTAFDRTVWLVSGDDASQVEVAWDRGWVHAAGQSSRINELELELLAGSASALFNLADHIACSVAVLPATESKAQRGFALAYQNPGLNLPHTTDTHTSLVQDFAYVMQCIHAVYAAGKECPFVQLSRALEQFLARIHNAHQVISVALLNTLLSITQSSVADQHSAVLQLLCDVRLGQELLKISRWLELDF